MQMRGAPALGLVYDSCSPQPSSTHASPLHDMLLLQVQLRIVVRMQFGSIAYGLVKTGGVRALFQQLPTNPRFVAGTFQGAPQGAWAVTLVTSNWNASTTALEGPQYIMDNATLWAARSFEVALPLLRDAYSSTDPPAWCYDAVAGSARCMAAGVQAQYQEPRSSTAIFGPQFSPGTTTQPSTAGFPGSIQGLTPSPPPPPAAPSSTSALAWALPMSFAIIIVALAGARRAHFQRLSWLQPRSCCCSSGTIVHVTACLQRCHLHSCVALALSGPVQTPTKWRRRRRHSLCHAPPQGAQHRPLAKQIDAGGHHDDHAAAGRHSVVFGIDWQLQGPQQRPRARHPLWHWQNRLPDRQHICADQHTVAAERRSVH